MNSLRVFFIFCWVVCSNVALADAINVNNGADLQKALIDVLPNQRINLAEGIYHLNAPIAIFQTGVEITGAGKDKTILDFSAVTQAAQAILIRANNVQVKGFSILNAPGDGVVSRNVSNIVFDDLKVHWSPNHSVGGYGIYPVLGRDIVVKNSEAYGASEAGIYVGQTLGAEVYGNIVKGNVAGIDVENSSNVWVANNYIEANSLGIVLSGRPYFVVGNPKAIKLEKNMIKNNNLKSFASKNAFVSLMGDDVAINIIAVEGVTISSNTIEGSKKAINIDVFSSTGEPYITSENFNNRPKNIVLEYGNTFAPRNLKIVKDTKDKQNGNLSVIDLNSVLNDYPPNEWRSILCMTTQLLKSQKNVSQENNFEC